MGFLCIFWGFPGSYTKVIITDGYEFANRNDAQNENTAVSGDECSLLKRSAALSLCNEIVSLNNPNVASVNLDAARCTHDNKHSTPALLLDRQRSH